MSSVRRLVFGGGGIRCFESLERLRRPFMLEVPLEPIGLGFILAGGNDGIVDHLLLRLGVRYQCGLDLAHQLASLVGGFRALQVGEQ